MPLTEDDVLDLFNDGTVPKGVAKQAVLAIRAGDSLDLINGQIRRAETTGQRFEQLPPPAGTFGALASGAELGFKEIGAGALQIAGRAGEFAGIEGAETLGPSAQRVIEQERERFEAATAEQPITGQVGRIGGQLAAFPVGGVTIPRAIVAGATAGALQPTMDDAARGINALIGGTAGGIFQTALPVAINLIKAGANKLGAIARSVFESATGAAPPAGAFDEAGNPTAEFVKALQDAGISADDLDTALQAVDSPDAAKIVDALSGRFEQASLQGLEPAQAARLAEFEALGVPATQAQITREFGAAQAEDVARGSVGVAGTEARTFFAQQQQRLIEATRSFERSIGAPPGANRQERGAAIRAAIDATKQENKAEVKALYTRAKELAGDQTQIASRDLENVFFSSVDELPVEDSVVKPLERALAKFGVFEGEVTRKGANSVLKRADGSTVEFRGEPELLNLANAEKLRQRFNQVFTSDRSGTVVALKNQLDNLVNKTLDDATSGARQAQEATAQARAGFQEFKKTFEAANIVGKITGVGRDRTTPLIDDSIVIDRILKSANKLENIQRIKSALGKTESAQGKAAIKELQRGFVDNIFKKAITDTPDGAVISGLKLNSELDRLGVDAMKELFPPALLTEFNSLRRVIGNATIPVPRTTNPSGSGGRILNAVIRISGLVDGLPGIGNIARFGMGALRRSIEKGEADAAEEVALAGIREARIAEKVTPKAIQNEQLLARFLSLYTPRVATRATITQQERLQ